MQTLLRSAALTTTHLWFTVRATTAVSLDMYSGAALRGSFFHALWTRFCTNKSAVTCASCPLNEICPVSSIVAPLREDNVGGQDIQRPYVIIPPREGAHCYQPGEAFSFGMTLFGHIVNLLPYIMLSISELEAEGLGQRLNENAGRRGRFHVEQVEVIHPWTQQRQSIYTAGNPLVNTPIISVHVADCLERATQLNADSVTLTFLTPLRLVDREHLIKRAEFRPLLQRLLERYYALERHYGNAELILSKEERDQLLQQADAISCSNDQTIWQDLRSYSNRQKRATPIGGLIGQATFTGNLTELLPYLLIGELIHIGKNAVKGNGWYRIEASKQIE
ncbi:CRISPR system precrRNA processing endoribonuclease RAMP protein Cas6 [Dictyobacter arantiisoli]|uniref:CRISPR-associated protein Cas6 C-terminal domain-containing protein n=1 Tax=Dictyobacter arantiisoli TaxID=2014874 RepID=A0A5A5TJQ3_9CHLR|nr:CRISPR system precrRNA processing endoribonuclease RAMP protein Cas6 [Dictyobacter arantiisoli]GCF11253.1 hypothetical protein KDI_48170 [Dictyobacter arantiisoli]